MENIEIAKKFSEKVLQRFGDLIKAVVLFGSTVKGKESGDVDVLIIVDDTVIPWTTQTFSMVFNGIGEILEKMEEKEKIHSNILTLTAFIENVIKGDPITVNIIRNSTAIYDSGIYMPIKRLLSIGKIKPSAEAIVASYKRANLSLGRAKWKLLSVLVDLYWAMILSAEALLMAHDIVPEHPSIVPEQLDGILEDKYRRWLEEIYKIQKEIARFNKKDVDTEEIKEWLKRAEEFIKVCDEKIKEAIKQS